MDLTLQRETLLKPLQMVASVVERRQTMPILSHILLELKNNTLILAGTDLEVELLGIAKLDEPVKDGVITLSGRKFLDICKALPENAVINIHAEQGRAIITSERSKFTLATLDAKDFPRTPEQESVIEFTIPEQSLRLLIEKTAFAIPQQDVRQFLNGLLIEVKDGSIQSLATDGHRLALYNVDATVINNTFAQVIVPRKGILELGRLLGGSNNEVLVRLNNNYIRVEGKDFILTSKLISGKFPNYNKIIPKSGGAQMLVDRDALKRALNCVGILSNEMFRHARFQIQPGLLRLFSSNFDQEEAVDELKVEFDGENIDTIFNINYLLDILNSIESEKVCFSFKSPESGVVIEEVNGSGGLYLLMPIRQ